MLDGPLLDFEKVRNRGMTSLINVWAEEVFSPSFNYFEQKGLFGTGISETNIFSIPAFLTVYRKTITIEGFAFAGLRQESSCLKK